MKYAISGLVGFLMILASFYFMCSEATPANIILCLALLLPGVAICSCSLAWAIAPDDLP